MRKKSIFRVGGPKFRNFGDSPQISDPGQPVPETKLFQYFRLKIWNFSGFQRFALSLQDNLFEKHWKLENFHIKNFSLKINIKMKIYLNAVTAHLCVFATFSLKYLMNHPSHSSSYLIDDCPLLWQFLKIISAQSFLDWTLKINNWNIWNNQMVGKYLQTLTTKINANFFKSRVCFNANILGRPRSKTFRIKKWGYGQQARAWSEQ